MGFFDWFFGKPNASGPPAPLSDNFRINDESDSDEQPTTDETVQNPLSFLNESTQSGSAEAESLEARIEYKSLLYAFQHIVLRDDTFENNPTLIENLNNPSFPLPLLHVWSGAAIRCEEVGKLPESWWEQESDLESDSPSPSTKLIKSIKFRRYQQYGYTIYVVTMPKPYFPALCHLTAIVYKDDEPHEYGTPSPSTRYFTLERAEVPNITVFCEWSREGAHLNYGTGVDPDEKIFAKAVLKRVLKK